jgi:DNA polymerase I-like protein with 3'-5' exonuclease and polymerase domains
MVRLDKVLEYPKCKMLVQVHDELLVSVPTNELKLWIPRVEEAMGNGEVLLVESMEDARPVKLVVEAHSAGSWEEAKG